MTSLQIDMLHVMSFTQWMTANEIRVKLEVECDRTFRDSNIPIIFTLSWLQIRGWIESQPDEMTAEEIERAKGGAKRFVYRRAKNGSRLPDLPPSWILGTTKQPA